MTCTQNSLACPALLVDGSGSSFFSGVLGGDGDWLAFEKAAEPALESLFKTVDRVLQSAAIELEAIRSFIYCEGPGSVLGLRLCAMAIETWRHIHAAPMELYAYNSLQLLAARLQKENKITAESLLISDWKKDYWNSLTIGPEGAGEVCPISADELAQWQGPLYHLPARKGWQTPPANAMQLGYDPECLNQLLPFPDLLQARDQVELYNSGINTFQKWRPERHRATTSR
ncbi:MAG: hypothetical protein ACNA77_03445 [Opitutales bacterium]